MPADGEQHQRVVLAAAAAARARSPVAEIASDSRPTTIRIPVTKRPEVVRRPRHRSWPCRDPRAAPSQSPRRPGRPRRDRAIGIRSPGSRKASATMAAMPAAVDAGHRDDGVQGGHHHRDPGFGTRDSMPAWTLRRARCPAAPDSSMPIDRRLDRPQEQVRQHAHAESPAAMIGAMTAHSRGCRSGEPRVLLVRRPGRSSRAGTSTACRSPTGSRRSAANAASVGSHRNAPSRIRNSPTKPFSPGRPIDDSVMMRKRRHQARRHLLEAAVSEIRRVCRRSDSMPTMRNSPPVLTP